MTGFYIFCLVYGIVAVIVGCAVLLIIKLEDDKIDIPTIAIATWVGCAWWVILLAFLAITPFLTAGYIIDRGVDWLKSGFKNK